MNRIMAIAFVVMLAPTAYAAENVEFAKGALWSGVVEHNAPEVTVLHGQSDLDLSLSGSIVGRFSEHTGASWQGPDVGFSGMGTGPVETAEDPIEGYMLEAWPNQGFSLTVRGGHQTVASQTLELRSAANNAGDIDRSVPPAYPGATSTTSSVYPTAVFVHDSVSSFSVTGTFELTLYGWTGHVDSTEQSFETGMMRKTTAAGGSLATHRYLTFSVSDGALAVETDRVQAISLGASSSVTTVGTAHLALANAKEPSWGRTEDEYWRLEGNFSMLNVQPGTDGFSSELSGDLSSFEADGQAVAVPSSLASPAVTAVAVAAAGVLVWKILAAALFTRLTAEQALEHPNRQKLTNYIVDNPGATFREVLRGTNLSAGTSRHHLSVLIRSKVIVEHRHHSTLRFFENHGRYEDTWDAVVMLREPELKQTHAWFMANPEAIQKDFLEASAGWGWTRSTAQHRIRRLVDAGLLTIVQQGRRKLYTAHKTTGRAHETHEAHPRTPWSALRRPQDPPIE